MHSFLRTIHRLGIANSIVICTSRFGVRGLTLHLARRNEINTEAIRRIGELYAIEAEIRGKPPTSEDASDENERAPYWTPSKYGCARRSAPFRTKVIPRRPSITH